MCLIIMQNAGATLPAQAIENGWSHNDDGAGYMFVDDSGKLIIRKPFFKLKHLLRSYRRDWAICGARSPFVIHLRYATHGIKDDINTHPHAICGGNVGLVHNGILSNFEPPFDSDISDTVHFCRTVLAYRCPEHVVDDRFRDILAEMIGEHNKFVLLSHTRAISIVNEERGTWDGSVWFSNHTYRKAYAPPLRLPAAYTSGQSGFVPHANGTLFGTPAARVEHSALCVCNRCEAERPFPHSDDEELETYVREKRSGLDFDSMDDAQWRELALERELDRAIERDTR